MEEGNLTERIGQIEQRVAAMLQQETKLKIENQQLKSKLAKRKKQIEEEGDQSYGLYLETSIANHEQTLAKYKQLYASLMEQQPSASRVTSGKGMFNSGSQCHQGNESMRVVKEVYCEGCGLSWKPNRYYQHLPNCAPNPNPPPLTTSMLIS